MNKTSKSKRGASDRIAKTEQVTSTGTGAGARAVSAILGRSPDLTGGQMIVAGLLSHAVSGDITGRQGTGGGAGPRLRKARPVGVGLDDDTRAANDFAAWVDSSPARAEIGAACVLQASGWQALQTLAKRAARRAAQRLQELRGVNVSETSRDDAAADAVNACAMRFPSGCVKVRNFTGARVRILARIAGGAAFRSLSRWSVAGMTGTDAGKQAVFWSSVFDVVKHNVAQDHTPAPFEGTGGDARRAACRWVYRVGLVDFKATLQAGNAGARARAIGAARSRCRVVCSIILGQSLFDSCAVHGFGSVAAFVNSCETAGLFPALCAARMRLASDGGHYEQARVAMRRYSLQAARAIRDLRALAPLAGDAARLGYIRDGWQVARIVKGRALFDERAACVARAVYYRNVARRALACDLRAFDRVLLRLTDESCDLSNLRAVMGMADKLGRTRHASKIDASGIRRGKGKVTRPARLAPVVSVPVVTRYGARDLACAPLAPSIVGGVL